MRADGRKKFVQVQQSRASERRGPFLHQAVAFVDGHQAKQIEEHQVCRRRLPRCFYQWHWRWWWPIEFVIVAVLCRQRKESQP